MPLFGEVLESVLSQDVDFDFEIVVADSASTDGTKEAATDAGATVLSISPSEFGHAVTRNRLAAEARGVHIVFLVQDAIPANESWLSSLVRSSSNIHGCIGSYSRQIPRIESRLASKYLCEGTTPVFLGDKIQQLDSGMRLEDLSPDRRLQLCLFQNASSCILRAAWEKNPFPNVEYGEDIAWGREVISAGHSIAYCGKSVVFHSHDRSALYHLKRAYADHHQACDLFGLCHHVDPLRQVRSVLWTIVQSWRFVRASNEPLRTKAVAYLTTPVYICARAVGTIFGSAISAGKLPVKLAGHIDRLCRHNV
jgi:rhamnosyltransferase